MLRVAAVLLVLLAAHHSTPAGRDTAAPRLLDFRASNGGHPFAGDGPMLTTLSPERGDTARIAFTLTEAARVVFRVEQTQRRRTIVSTQVAAFPAGGVRSSGRLRPTPRPAPTSSS